MGYLKKTIKVLVAVAVVISLSVFMYLSRHCMVLNKEQYKFLGRILGPLKPDDPKLISYIRKYSLDEPSTEPYAYSKEKNGLQKELSWKFINDLLVQLFENEPPGFFVEAGALDGQLLSNTLWLEETKNWTGLLVEPDSSNYKSLLQIHRKAWTSHSCISTVPYPKMATFVGYSPLSKKDDDFQNKNGWFIRSLTFETENGLDLSPGSHPIYQKLQCFPLESFVLALNVTKVDFLSLDIQGGEWDVLKHWPWGKITLRTAVIEYIKTVRDRGVLDQDFVDFMEQKGYALVGTSLEPDYFFVLKDDPLYKRYAKNYDKNMTSM